MLQAIIAGESNPETLVAVTNGRLKASHDSLVAAARGTTRKISFCASTFVAAPRKAIVAVPAPILTATYYMLRDHTTYVDPTASHFQKHDKQKTADRLVRQLCAIGYSVKLEAAA